MLVEGGWRGFGGRWSGAEGCVGSRGAPNKNIGDAFLLVWKPKGDTNLLEVPPTPRPTQSPIPPNSPATSLSRSHHKPHDPAVAQVQSDAGESRWVLGVMMQRVQAKGEHSCVSWHDGDGMRGQGRGSRWVGGRAGGGRGAAEQPDDDAGDATVPEASAMGDAGRDSGAHARLSRQNGLRPALRVRCRPLAAPALAATLACTG
eukprot:1421198-Rhodomonas_salina.1